MAPSSDLQMRKSSQERSLLLLPHNTTHSSLETIGKGNAKINMNAGTLTMEQGIESQVLLLKEYFSTKLGTYSL